MGRGGADSTVSTRWRAMFGAQLAPQVGAGVAQHRVMCLCHRVPNVARLRLSSSTLLPQRTVFRGCGPPAEERDRAAKVVRAALWTLS